MGDDQLLYRGLGERHDETHEFIRKRIELGLSVEGAARRMGLSPDVVEALEAGNLVCRDADGWKRVLALLDDPEAEDLTQDERTG